jgi:hypothetical protein
MGICWAQAASGVLLAERVYVHVAASEGQSSQVEKGNALYHDAW